MRGYKVSNETQIVGSAQKLIEQRIQMLEEQAIREQKQKMLSEISGSQKQRENIINNILQLSYQFKTKWESGVTIWLMYVIKQVMSNSDHDYMQYYRMNVSEGDQMGFKQNQNMLNYRNFSENVHPQYQVNLIHLIKAQDEYNEDSNEQDQQDEEYDEEEEELYHQQYQQQMFPVNARSGFEEQVSRDPQFKSSLQIVDQIIKRKEPLMQIPVANSNYIPDIPAKVVQAKIKPQQQSNDNDFLINLRIQEQMRKFEQDKITKQQQESEEKNKVKQHVWEQLFKDQREAQQQQPVKPVQIRSNKPNNNEESKIVNAQSSTNSYVANQYINNFIINQIKPQKKEELPTSNSYVSRTPIFKNLQYQVQESQKAEFSDRFSSQLFQIPENIVKNHVSLEYKDSLQASVDDSNQQFETSTFGKSIQGYDDIYHMGEKQVETKPIAMPAQISETKEMNDIIDGKQHFSKTGKFDGTFLEKMNQLPFKMKRQEDEQTEIVYDDEEDEDDLNTRQSDVMLQNEEKLILQQRKKDKDYQDYINHLQQIQEEEESVYNNEQSNQNWNPQNIEDEVYENDVQSEDNNENNQEDYQDEQSQFRQMSPQNTEGQQIEKEQNKFIQFDVGLDEDKDESRRLDLMRKKKIEEMERQKQQRLQDKIVRKQVQDNEQEINATPTNRAKTPTRERSPLMPSASIKSKKSSNQDNESYRSLSKKNSFENQPQQKQKQGDRGNIFKEESQFATAMLPPKQSKANLKEKEDSLQKQKKDQQERPVSGKLPTKNRVNSAQRINTKQSDTSITSTKNKKNNRLILRNAIQNVCLAGDPNKKDRDQIIAQLESAEAEHFIILLKGQFGRMDFKALYGMASSDSVPELLFQTQKSPQILEATLVLDYYKYDSGAKEFKQISGNKNFSFIVDAVKLRK